MDMKKFIVLCLNVGLIYNLVQGDGCTQVVKMSQDLEYRIKLTPKEPESIDSFKLEVSELMSRRNTGRETEITITLKLKTKEIQEAFLGFLSQKMEAMEGGAVKATLDEGIKSVLSIFQKTPLPKKEDIRGKELLINLLQKSPYKNGAIGFVGGACAI